MGGAVVGRSAITLGFLRATMTSNAEMEMRWAEAWNDAYDIAGIARNAPCLLPDGSIITFHECLGWLQDSVYEGYLVQVAAGWVGHLQGIIATRSKSV